MSFALLGGTTALRPETSQLHLEEIVTQHFWREMMAIAGVIVTFLGFLIAAASVGLTSSNGMRLVIVLAGIAISLGGIMGLINPAYQKNAVWKL